MAIYLSDWNESLTRSVQYLNFRTESNSYQSSWNRERLFSFF